MRLICFRFWGWLHSIQFHLYRVNCLVPHTISQEVKKIHKLILQHYTGTNIPGQHKAWQGQEKVWDLFHPWEWHLFTALHRDKYSRTAQSMTRPRKNVRSLPSMRVAPVFCGSTKPSLQTTLASHINLSHYAWMSPPLAEAQQLYS